MTVLESILLALLALSCFWLFHACYKLGSTYILNKQQEQLLTDVLAENERLKAECERLKAECMRQKERADRRTVPDMWGNN